MEKFTFFFRQAICRDYNEKDKTDKSGKSTGRKIIALGATAALIALTAFAGSVAAQGDWSYPQWDAVGYDSADTFGNPFTNGGVYAPGSTVTVKATAKDDYMTPVVIEIYDEHDKNIYTEDLGTIADITVTRDVTLPQDAPQGAIYRIDTNGITTDYFTVEGVPIPEFPTVAVPLVVAILLGLRFMKKGCKSPRT